MSGQHTVVQVGARIAGLVVAGVTLVDGRADCGVECIHGLVWNTDDAQSLSQKLGGRNEVDGVQSGSEIALETVEGDLRVGKGECACAPELRVQFGESVGGSDAGGGPLLVTQCWFDAVGAQFVDLGGSTAAYRSRQDEECIAAGFGCYGQNGISFAQVG